MNFLSSEGFYSGGGSPQQQYGGGGALPFFDPHPGLPPMPPPYYNTNSGGGGYPFPCHHHHHQPPPPQQQHHQNELYYQTAGGGGSPFPPPQGPYPAAAAAPPPLFHSYQQHQSQQQHHHQHHRHHQQQQQQQPPPYEEQQLQSFNQSGLGPADPSHYQRQQQQEPGFCSNGSVYGRSNNHDDARPAAAGVEAQQLSTAKRSAFSTLLAHQRSLYGSAGASGGGRRKRGGGGAGASGGALSSNASPFVSSANGSGGGSVNNRGTADGSAGSNNSTATANDTTATTARDDEDCCIAAILHNGAKEVGVALVSFPALSIAITQFGDTATYAKLLALLYGRNPVEVLVADTTLDEPLTQILVDHFKDEVTLTSVPRRYFACEKGVARLNALTSSPEATLAIEDTDRYLCVAAANALVTYVEGISDMQFMPGSVAVRTITLDHYANIPRAAARALHIICPSGGYTGSLRPASRGAAAAATAAGTGGGGGGGGGSKRNRGGTQSTSSATTQSTPSQQQRRRLETVPLVDALPRTCTPMGQRLLRSSLLQPLRDRRGIEYRLDAVAWLLADPAGRMDRLRRTLSGLSSSSSSSFSSGGSHGMDLERMAVMVNYSAALRPLQGLVVMGDDGNSGLNLNSDANVNKQPLNFHHQTSQPQPPPPTQHQRHQRQLERQHLATVHVERNKRVVGCLMDYWQAVEVLTGLEATLTRLLPSPPGTDQQRRLLNPAQSQSSLFSSSSPENPRLLQHLLLTLRACELTSLRDVLEEHLDGAVREPRQPFTAIGGGSSAPGRDGNINVAAGGGGGGRRGTTTSSKASQHSRLTRLAFAVRSAPGSVLDAARSRYSEQVRLITDHYMRLCTSFQIFSLRLEPDAANLFCLSYAATEERKTAGAPFRGKYAGGNHFALYKRALQDRALRHQQFTQQQREAVARTTTTRRRQYTRNDGDVSDNGGGGGNNTSLAMSASERGGGGGGGGGSSHYTDDDDGDDDDGKNEDSSAHLNHGGGDGGLPPPYLDALSNQRTLPTIPSGGEDGTTTPTPTPTGSSGKSKVRVKCSTEELDSLCQQAGEHLCLVFAEEVDTAEALLAALRGRLGCMQAMAEAVALLDMVIAFAVYSFSNHCTRPVFITDGEEGEGSEGGVTGEAAPSSGGGRGAGRDESSTAAAAAEASFDEHRHRGEAAAAAAGGGGGATESLGTDHHNYHDSDSDDVQGNDNSYHWGDTPSVADGGGGALGSSGLSLVDSSTGAAGRNGNHSTAVGAADRCRDGRRAATVEANRGNNGAGGDCAGAQLENTPSVLHYRPRNHRPQPAHKAAAATTTPTVAAAVAAPPLSQRICIREARHPSQAPHQLLTGSSGVYPSAASVRATANTITWEPGVRVLLITGPNATGKSTLLRIVGQLCALAQCGCFVPCTSASLPIADSILTHMLCDELPSSRHSSQRRELMELAELTHTATGRSLVLMDELGRSMLSLEGFTLAWSAAQWLRSVVRCRAVAFVTHFTELTEVSRLCADVANAHFSLTLSTFQGGSRYHRHDNNTGSNAVDTNTNNPNGNNSGNDGVDAPTMEAASLQLVTDVCSGRTTMCASHLLRPGACKEAAYGLTAAASVGLYPPVLAVAGRLYGRRESQLRRGLTVTVKASDEDDDGGGRDRGDV